MIATGKCPKCGTVVSKVKMEDVEGMVGFESRWKCVSYCCPSCNTVLGVEVDPIASKTDIVNSVVSKLKGRV